MGFPDMSGAFWNWADPVQLNVVTTSAVDFEAVDTPENQIVFYGVLEPVTGRQLLIKPEGERKFNYLNLYTEQELKADSIVQDQKGQTYRVLKKQDWNHGDYQEYEIMQTPTPPYAGA